jgi:tetratricopeptide (TPR) repeat protein
LALSVVAILTLLDAAACSGQTNPSPSPTPVASVRPLGWRYPTEQSWLVGETLGSIAGLAHFARTRTVAAPEAIDFSVQQIADERSTTAPRATFSVARRDGRGGEAFRLEITEHIFSPTSFARPAAKWLGDAKAAAAPDPPRQIADRLLDLRLETLHAAQKDVSDALTRNPLSADGHEDAALVVAAFGLREAAAGHTDPRRLLIRTTAHLAMAEALRGQAPPGESGRLARTAALVLAGRTAETADRTATPRPDASPAERIWTRALHLFATKDPRELSWSSRLSVLERIAWFKAFQERIGSDRAYVLLETLPADLRALPDWGRIRLKRHPTVRDCHEFAVGGFRYDLEEAARASRLFRGTELDPAALANALNAEEPVSAVVTVAGTPRVEVLGWGAVAAFVQRHLGARLSYEVACYERTFGLADQTTEMLAQQESLFGDLTQFPLDAHRWTKKAEPYRRHAEAAARLIKEHPEVVTAHSWERLLEPPTFAQPPDVPADTVWFDPPLPLGTHFSIAAFYGPSNNRRPSDAESDAVVRVDPYDTGFRWAYAKRKFGAEPSYEQMLGAYGPALEWDVNSMLNIARLAKSIPDTRRRWLTRACEIEPDECNSLARFLVDVGDEAGAAEAYRRWWREAIDRVAVANGVAWLVKYDMKHAREAEAWEVARDAASTYSGGGLRALSDLEEETGRIDEAEKTVRKSAERYDQPEALYSFYSRQIAKGHKRFEASREAVVKSVFPDGFETVTSTPSEKPMDGAFLADVTPEGATAGFRKGDILVALDGVRVHSVKQFYIIRFRSTDPEMRVLVYRGGAYLEIRGTFKDRGMPGSLSLYPPTR